MQLIPNLTMVVFHGLLVQLWFSHVRARTSYFLPVAATSSVPVTNPFRGQTFDLTISPPNVGSKDVWFLSDEHDEDGDGKYDFADAAPVLTLDLGQDMRISELTIWNYPGMYDLWGSPVTSFELTFATEADGSIGSSSITYNPTFSFTPEDTFRPEEEDGRTTQNVGKVFVLERPLTFRYMAIKLTDNFYGLVRSDGATFTEGGSFGGTRVGIGEVIFGYDEFAHDYAAPAVPLTASGPVPAPTGGILNDPADVQTTETSSDVVIQFPDGHVPVKAVLCDQFGAAVNPLSSHRRGEPITICLTSASPLFTLSSVQSLVYESDDGSEQVAVSDGYLQPFTTVNCEDILVLPSGCVVSTLLFEDFYDDIGNGGRTIAVTGVADAHEDPQDLSQRQTQRFEITFGIETRPLLLLGDSAATALSRLVMTFVCGALLAAALVLY